MTSDEEIKFCINRMLSVRELGMIKENVDEEEILLEDIPEDGEGKQFFLSPSGLSPFSFDEGIKEAYKSSHNGNEKTVPVRYWHVSFCCKKCDIFTLETLTRRLYYKLGGRILEAWLSDDGSQRKELYQENDSWIMGRDYYIETELDVSVFHLIVCLCSKDTGVNITEDRWGYQEFRNCFRNLVIFKKDDYVCGEAPERSFEDITLRLDKETISYIVERSKKKGTSIDFAADILLNEGVKKELEEEIALLKR